MSGMIPALMMGGNSDLNLEDIRSWVFDNPSDHDLARAYADVHNHIACNMYEENVPDEIRKDWELLEHQMLYQIAKRWLPSQGISWSAGWWIDDGKGKIYETIDFPETKDGDLVVPYGTPIGGVCLWVDGDPSVSDAHWESDGSGEYAKAHPVDGNCRIAYHHTPDGNPHVVECKLIPLRDCVQSPATGERLIAVEVNDDESTVIIGVEWDECESVYDYVAGAIDYGVEVTLPAEAKEQWLVFGLAWVEEAADENATNPWLMGDPLGDRQNIPVNPEGDKE